MISFKIAVTVHPSLYKQQHAGNAEKMEKLSFVPRLNT